MMISCSLGEKRLAASICRPVQCGTARALTVGKFEVTHVVFSQDRKRLVYSSTQDDTDRMHIWTVDVEHGSAVRTGQSHAIEDLPQIGADGALSHCRATATNRCIRSR